MVLLKQSTKSKRGTTTSSSTSSITTTNKNSHNSPNKAGFCSVLNSSIRKFPLRATIESRVQKAFPKVARTEIPSVLTDCLIRFLELKVVLEEYSPDSSDHLLATTPLMEEAWLALYGDCELYPQVIMGIQTFHGLPHRHVFLRRTACLHAEDASFSTVEQEDYWAKLARTQSLMQCYYQTTMPNNLQELSTTTLHLEQEQQQEEEQEDDIISFRPEDLPSVVVPENDDSDSEDDSSLASSCDDDTYADTNTYASSITNDTTLSLPNNWCLLLSRTMFHRKKKKTHHFHRNDKKYNTRHHHRQEKPSTVNEIVFDDITVSVTSSEGSPTLGREKKPYEKLESRWEDAFKCFWV